MTYSTRRSLARFAAKPLESSFPPHGFWSILLNGTDKCRLRTEIQQNLFSKNEFSLISYFASNR